MAHALLAVVCLLGNGVLAGSLYRGRSLSPSLPFGFDLDDGNPFRRAARYHGALHRSGYRRVATVGLLGEVPPPSVEHLRPAGALVDDVTNHATSEGALSTTTHSHLTADSGAPHNTADRARNRYKGETTGCRQENRPCRPSGDWRGHGAWALSDFDDDDDDDEDDDDYDDDDEDEYDDGDYYDVYDSGAEYRYYGSSRLLRAFGY